MKHSFRGQPTILYSIEQVNSSASEDGMADLASVLQEREDQPEAKTYPHWFNVEGIIENNFGYGACRSERDFTRDDETMQT